MPISAVASSPSYPSQFPHQATSFRTPDLIAGKIINLEKEKTNTMASLTELNERFCFMGHIDSSKNLADTLLNTLEEHDDIFKDVTLNNLFFDFNGCNKIKSASNNQYHFQNIVFNHCFFLNLPPYFRFSFCLGTIYVGKLNTRKHFVLHQTYKAGTTARPVPTIITPPATPFASPSQKKPAKPSFGWFPKFASKSHKTPFSAPKAQLIPSLFPNSTLPRTSSSKPISSTIQQYFNKSNDRQSYLSGSSESAVVMQPEIELPNRHTVIVDNKINQHFPDPLPKPQSTRNTPLPTEETPPPLLGKGNKNSTATRPCKKQPGQSQKNRESKIPVLTLSKTQKNKDKGNTYTQYEVIDDDISFITMDNPTGVDTPATQNEASKQLMNSNPEETDNQNEDEHEWDEWDDYSFSCMLLEDEDLLTSFLLTNEAGTQTDTEENAVKNTIEMGTQTEEAYSNIEKTQNGNFYRFSFSVEEKSLQSPSHESPESNVSDNGYESGIYSFWNSQSYA